MVCRVSRAGLIEKKYAGFLLVQMVVYLALTTLIILCTMQWTVTALMHYYRVIQSNKRALTIACATDVWMRDMRAACGPLYYTHDKWLWCIGNTYVAWYLKDHALIRAEGNYTNALWHERTQSLMAEDIALLDIKHEHARATLMVESVNTTLSEASYRCARIVHTYV